MDYNNNLPPLPFCKFPQGTPLVIQCTERQIPFNQRISREQDKEEINRLLSDSETVTSTRAPNYKHENNLPDYREIFQRQSVDSTVNQTSDNRREDIEEIVVMSILYCSFIRRNFTQRVNQ